MKLIKRRKGYVFYIDDYNYRAISKTYKSENDAHKALLRNSIVWELKSRNAEILLKTYTLNMTHLKRDIERISKTNIFEPRRLQKIVTPRQVFHHIARNYLEDGFEKIAKFSNVDHATVMHSCKVIDNMLLTNDRLIIPFATVLAKYNAYRHMRNSRK